MTGRLSYVGGPFVSCSFCGRDFESMLAVAVHVMRAHGVVAQPSVALCQECSGSGSDEWGNPCPPCKGQGYRQRSST